MKKLLFLVGLIMVTTACSVNENKVSNEEDKESCYSFAGKDEYNNLIFCKANYDDKEKAVFFDISDFSGDRKFSYPLTDIKEEYLDLVKRNKVAISYYKGKCSEPFVVEKDTSTEVISDFEQDKRRFIFKPILKSSSCLNGMAQYAHIYEWLIAYGYCKAGDQTLKEGRFFFAEADFAPEKTGKDYASKGLFSAALTRYLPQDARGKNHLEDKFGRCFTVVQTFCEDAYFVIRLENGDTYRYPFEALSGPDRFALLLTNQPKISAVQYPNGNYGPIGIEKGYESFKYKKSLWITPHDFIPSLYDDDIQRYNNFMINAGIALNSKYEQLDPFFYSRKE